MIKIRWLGHACFLIEGKGTRLIIDPWIKGNPCCPIKLEELPKVDHLLITHDHDDHLGDAVDIAKRDNSKVIAIYELAEYLRGLGVKECIGANIGGWFEVDDISYMLTPATHSSIHGSPTGFMIKIDDFIIYHAGDTGIFNEMELLGRLYRINLAMIPIGGYYTMGIREAVMATMMISPRIVIPMHYNTFPAIKVNPERFKSIIRDLRPDIQVRILKPGEEMEF